MAEETELWIHQESAVISAQSHDIWSFSPEFLLSTEIVPNHWECSRASRTQSTVDIRYGPTNWRMTESHLWIDTWPDCPSGTSLHLEGDPITPLMARRFLESVPHLPSRRLWFFWQISALVPDPLRWLFDNFSPREWPPGFTAADLEIEFTLRKDNWAVQMTVKNDQMERNTESHNSLVFDCFVSVPTDQAVRNMIPSTDSWTDRVLVVEQAIKHLCERG